MAQGQSFQGGGEASALTGDARLPEELPADYRFFQRRSDGATALGLSASSPDAAGYLLNSARSLGLDRDNYRLLEARLADNVLTVTEENVMEGFDAANANRTQAAGIRKSLAAARRFDGYEPLLDTMTPQERRNILRETLKIAARTGQMPLLYTHPENPGLAGLAYRQARVLPGGERGTFRINDQLHFRGYDARTNEAVFLGSTPETVHTISEGNAYNSDGHRVQREQVQRLEEAFGSRKGRRALNSLYDGAFQAMEDPAKMRRLLLPVVQSIEKAYGLSPVDFQVNPEPVSPGNMAAFEPDNHRVIINHQAMVEGARDYMAENRLNFSNPAHRERLRGHIFRELVDSTAHELTHADQARRIRALEAGGLRQVGDANRVEDYRINTDYYNSAGETWALIGRDHGHYRHQPLEADAWGVGRQAAQLAMKALSRLPSAETI